MSEPDAASHDASLVSAVRALLEQFAVADASMVAEAVTLHRDHRRWAVWLPAAGGEWAAARPVSLRAPGPEVPMLWVRADSAQELGAAMQQADGWLSPGQGRLSGGWSGFHHGSPGRSCGHAGSGSAVSGSAHVLGYWPAAIAGSG